MDVATLHSNLVKKQLESIYIFTGEEIEVQNIYINQIAKIAELDVVRADSIKDVYKSIKNRSMIKNYHCYVIRDDTDYMNNEELQEKLPTVLGHNIVVFLITTLDKRKKFYKTYKTTIIEFESLKIEILRSYIHKKIKLNAKNTDLLIELCENNYGRILLEIDKIKTYSDSTDRNYDESFTKLLEEGVIYKPPKDAIFDFVDAILTYNVKKVYRTLQDCRAVGESSLVMLSVLYTNTKQVLQIQSYSGNDVCKASGLTAWQVKCNQHRLNVYSNSELIYIMRLIQRLETSIKTGEIEESFVIDYLLSRIFLKL